MPSIPLNSPEPSAENQDADTEDTGMMTRTATMAEMDHALAVREKSFDHNSSGKNKLPFYKKMLYAMPQFSTVSLTVMIHIHGVMFYEKIGVSLPAIAFISALANAMDLVSNPAMAYISDAGLCVGKLGMGRRCVRGRSGMYKKRSATSSPSGEVCCKSACLSLSCPHLCSLILLRLTLLWVVCDNLT